MCVVCLLGGASAAPEAASPFPLEAQAFPLAEPSGLTATWTGCAGLLLEQDGVRIAFDPFVSRPGLVATLLRRPQSDRAAVARWFSGVAAAFVGHTHFDHALDLPALAEVAPQARLIGSATTVELCRRGGVDPTRLEAAVDGSGFRVGPFHVEAVGAEHGVVPLVRWVDVLDLPPTGLPSTPLRYPRGPVLAWRVQARGRSVYVQGSAGLKDAALGRQRPVDVLVACAAARAGTPRYLERLGERLRPRVLVPTHHDDFLRPLTQPPRPIRTLQWPGFLAEAAGLERAHGTRLWLPARGAAAAW